MSTFASLTSADFANTHAIAKKTNLASFSVIPANRNLADTQTGAMRQIKQLDIKREAVDPCRFKNRSAPVEAKGFKAASCIPKRQRPCDSHKQIENATSLLAPPRLMTRRSNCGPAAREPSAMSTSPFATGSIRLGRFLKRRGESAWEKTPIALRGKPILNGLPRLSRDSESFPASARRSEQNLIFHADCSGCVR